MIEQRSVAVWAQEALGRSIDDAASALRRYCERPRSARRLHAARRCLAKLRAALEDLGTAAGSRRDFYAQVDELHHRAGKIRDADVLLESIRAYCERTTDSQDEPLRSMLAALRRKRKRARRKFERAVRTLPELDR
jgi:CHAD domain-containing protein